MSKFTNVAENTVADYLLRGVVPTWPTSWLLGLASAADDGSFTELAGAGYARQGIDRSLAAWSGTQASGSTLPSTGTSHRISNNDNIDFGVAGAAWGTATHVVLFNQAGVAWAYAELDEPIVVAESDPVVLVAGQLQLTLGLVGGMSDYLSNKVLDLIFRGEAFAPPANLHFALNTGAPSNAGGGVEVSGGGYGRVSYARSLENFSGTQGAGTTSASSGTGGKVSNNNAIQWGAPSGSWGAVGWIKVMDAASGGNLWFWAPTAAVKTVNAGGSSPTIAPEGFEVTFA